MLNRDYLAKQIVEVLTEIQECSGRPVPVIGEDTYPMQDLEGFDSLNSVEATCMLSERLGFEVDPKLLIPSRAGQIPCVREIVDRLCQITAKQRGGKYE